MLQYPDRRPRRGVTLIELLVTLVTAGITVGAISVLTVDLLGSQKTMAILREQLFTRLHARSEVAWTLRRVRRQDHRQSAVEPTINDGTTNRPVITYVARRWDYRMDRPAGFAIGDPMVVDRDLVDDADDRDRSVTGILFQWGDALYRFEIDGTAAAAGGIAAPTFNLMTAGQLKNFCGTRRNDCEIIAVDINTFEVDYVFEPTAPSLSQYTVHWNVHLTPP
jgi:hypothetical protein